MKQTVVVAVLSLVCPVGTAFAAEPPAASAPAPAVPPAGKRIVFDGNSWFHAVPAGVAECATSAGIAGHETVRWSNRPDVAFFKEQKIDAYTSGVHWWMEAPWGNSEQLVTAGLEGNPDFKAYYWAAWLVGDGRLNEMKTLADYDASNIADVREKLEKTCRATEKIADRLNDKCGKRVVFLIPVGEATLRLREAILAGTYPGLTKQSEIWRDTMPHSNPHSWTLSAYCEFAALYRMSPVGLKLPGELFKDLTDEQHAVLQRIAWDVVSQAPYAGIAPFPKAEAAVAPR